MSNAPTRRNATQPQYARIWRWHFYAALLVIPFILWQSITGVLYLWHEEIADAWWPQLRWSQATNSQATPRTLDEQLAAIRAVRPTQVIQSIRVSGDPRRSTQVMLDAGNGLPEAAFVDPRDGRVLGILPSTTWLPGLTRGLHGGWPLGKPGSWLLELGACWMIVMVLTGLYLWWPRHSSGLAGVLYPRLRAGTRVFWRDLHAVVGMWCSAVMLAFLLTALPWTDVWGNQVLKPLQRLTDQVAPSGDGHAAHVLHAAAQADGAAPVLLQAMLEASRRVGLRGDLEIQPRTAPAPIAVRSRHGRASSEVSLQFDRRSGALLSQVSWSDLPVIPKLIATGVDLHEGSFFGRANQWFNSALVAALLWLVATGVISWYRRRPSGGLAAPPRRVLIWPSWLRASAVCLCLVLPLLGATVLLAWLVDRALFGRSAAA